MLDLNRNKLVYGADVLSIGAQLCLASILLLGAVTRVDYAIGVLLLTNGLITLAGVQRMRERASFVIVVSITCYLYVLLVGSLAHLGAASLVSVRESNLKAQAADAVARARARLILEVDPFFKFLLCAIPNRWNAITNEHIDA